MHILKFCKFYLCRPNKFIKRCYHFNNNVFGIKTKLPSNFQVSEEVLRNRWEQSQLYQLISAYREHGHKIATVNPVAIDDQSSSLPELNPNRYGLKGGDCFPLKGLLNVRKEEASLDDILDILHNIYCKTLSVEFTYVEDQEVKEWLSERFERLSEEEINPELKKKVAVEMLKSETFDKFLATKFVSLKRYGGEGAESMMSFFVEFFRGMAEGGVEDVVIGMPHRGRTNLLIGMLKLPPVKLFHKLAGNCQFPQTAKCTDDVLSHMTTSVDIEAGGKTIHVTTLYNPSHLEAVNPVSMGKSRSRHLSQQEGGYGRRNDWGQTTVNLQVHGDGALMGQGINQETLLMSKLPTFQVGGTVHLVVNNQIAFTTPPAFGRGTRYASDIAKLISAPVIHVNGDVPEDVIKATRLAVEYQRKFRQDIFIDLNCYRQWGHNELDDPTFTNPTVYQIIKNRRTVPDLYSEKLIKDGKITEEEVKEISKNYSAWLNTELKKADLYEPEENYFKGKWNGFMQAPNAVQVWDSGVNTNLLRHIGLKSVAYPQDFNIHRNILRSHVQGRVKKIEEEVSLDWSTAEALAFGSLLYQGFNIRISGQDVGRGTFSQRHAMLVDQENSNVFIPLNNIFDDQMSKIEISNSFLSEEAVLGFEYGMSIENPRNLIIWEAQFGDFFNGAQIQIDTFVTSGEAKWMQCSGLVMLLPHGYDGAGPEHSSCRIERFLQLTDSSETHPDGEDVNFQVANPTTPAQYFHLLRRQMIRNYRKPLVVVAPKTLLRLPDATSSLSEMGPGTSFKPVISDDNISKDNVTKVILASGKHYYALARHRKEANITDTALIRVEELCPFPTMQLQENLSKFKKAKVFIWSQEEPQNMGAWSFIKSRFENLVGRKIVYSGRRTLPTPAVAIGKVHTAESQYVITRPFEMK